MFESRSILRNVFAVLACVWTLSICVNVIRDLFRSNSNYFGAFFAVTIGFALVIFGDGFLLGLYLLVKRFFK